MAIAEKLFLKSTETYKKRIRIYTLIAILILSLSTYFIFFNKTDSEDIKGVEDSKETIVCVNNNTKQIVIDTLSNYLKDIPHRIVSLETSKECDISIARNIQDTNEYELLTTNKYILITNHTNNLTNISKDQLETSILSGKLNDKSITWDTATNELIETKYQTITGSSTYDIETIKSLARKENSYAIVPITENILGMKVISIDKIDPYKTDSLSYPLTDIYWISVKDHTLKQPIKTLLQELLTTSNNSKTTNILLTGSSTIGARSLFNSSIDNNIQNILKQADITQINNESPIFETCTQKAATNFYCTSSIQPLIDSGIDIVGVNGNHILDYGYPAFTTTLNNYVTNDIKYYGGGSNETDSHTVKVIEHNGTRYGFLGYNFNYPYSYYSLNSRAGSANIDLNILKSDISKALTQTDILFIDMQWGSDSNKEIFEYQTTYAQAAIDYGANIVYGTNTHNIQKVEEYNGGYIYYSLGNFITDDIPIEDSRSGIMIKLTYNGTSLINYEPIPTYINSKNITQLAEEETSDTIINNIINY